MAAKTFGFGIRYVEINDDIFTVGDTIDYLYWENQDVEHELYNATILSIDDGEITVKSGELEISIPTECIF